MAYGLYSTQVKERELAEFFSEFGPVAHCQIVKDHKKGWSRGWVLQMYVSCMWHQVQVTSGAC